MTAARRTERAIATRPDEQWSMDFVPDAPFDGWRVRAPTLVDDRTREALATVVDASIRGEHVAGAVERIAAPRGPPRLIRVDNGPGSVSKALDRRAYGRGVTLDFSRPGKPTDKASAESFNGRFRDGCLL